jgi:hypothetical protein
MRVEEWRSEKDYWEIRLWPQNTMNWKMFVILICVNVAILAPAVWHYTHQVKPSIVKETIVSCDNEQAASNLLKEEAVNACHGRWAGSIQFDKDTNVPTVVCAN